MGCAIVTHYNWVKSKRFEHAAVEDAAGARGISMEKMYRIFPKLLEARRHGKPIDPLTQYEISTYLDFPMKFFYHKHGRRQERMFVCGSGVLVCAFCEQVAEYRCDYPIGGGRTCDLPLCREHKTHRPEIGEDTDYCPHHRVGSEVRE